MGYGLRIEDDETNTALQVETLRGRKSPRNRMKGILRSIEDDVNFEISQTVTKIGKENCDINIISPQVELRQAVLEYDHQYHCFFIEDLNTFHGTYVNECRVQNSKVKLNHGDIIRFGHGGPRFEILTEIQTNPSVVRQHVWEDGAVNFPYLPFHSTTTASTIPTSNPYQQSFGRQSVPHPPTVRQRPVSANPSNGVFLQTRPLSGALTKDFSTTSKPSDQVLNLEEQVTQMTGEISRLEMVQRDRDTFQESVVINLKKQLSGLESEKSTIVDDTSRRLSILQNQITMKNDEIDHLQAENRKLKSVRFDGSVSQTNKIAELQTLLTRHDQNISSMQLEMEKAGKEKSKLSNIITTLQKEISAKDLLLRKSKTETEKYRVECRNKDMDISSLTAKIQRQTLSDQAKKDLKKKDEELSSIRYRMKKADEKVSERELTILNLKEQIENANKSIANSERSMQLLEDENTRYRSKSLQLENTEQNHRIQFENLKRKHDTFHQHVAELFSQHGYTFDRVLDDNDVLNYIKEIRNELDKSSFRLEEILREKEQVESIIPSDHELESLRHLLYDIESRLLRNGRTCHHLRQEVQRAQEISTCEQLQWIKSFVISMLSQESNWEQQIENALEAVKFQNNGNNTEDPTTLIHRLQIKLKENFKQLEDLENQINSADDEHSQLYKNIKNKIKEKYKKKMEEKIEEIKEHERNKFEKLRQDEIDRLSLELKIKEQELKNILRTQDYENNQIHQLKKRMEKQESEILEGQLETQKLKCELEESKQTEALYKKKMDDKEDEIYLQKQIMERKIENFQNAEISLLKDKSDTQSMTISSLENTLLEINKEKKDSDLKFMKMKNVLKEHKKELLLKKDEEKKSYAFLKKEINELKDLNKTLRRSFHESQKECEEQKDLVKSLKRDMNGMSIRMTDMKGELSEEEKMKTEELREQLSKQELAHLEQRKQLIQLSNLVDEQQKKLKEQERMLQVKNETLAFQADGLKEQTHNHERQVAMVRPAHRNTKKIAERCLEEKHDDVILRQKQAIADMRSSLKEGTYQKPQSALEEMALQELNVLKKENVDLKEQLVMTGNWCQTTDKDLYNEVCKSRDILRTAFHDYGIEKMTHQDTQQALSVNEELFLHTLQSISTELGIKHILGGSPMCYNDVEGRKELMKHREKALENILNRIKTLQERLKNKDKILEDYDEDLKKLRLVEQQTGKVSAENEAIKKEMLMTREENTFLQEALRKNKTDLENEKRMRKSIKQKKVCQDSTS
ncbi:forkhead-associated domain-containing protein 1-like isoform X1 [Clytia hemisphaerica]|uniref:forkhead-associated domain-containing protein 1-like isoform X1 n=2 Tax=Clytia hemisphaerica TaxID=252671 RepID=UPI0034D6671D